MRRLAATPSSVMLFLTVAAITGIAMAALIIFGTHNARTPWAFPAVISLLVIFMYCWFAMTAGFAIGLRSVAGEAPERAQPATKSFATGMIVGGSIALIGLMLEAFGSLPSLTWRIGTAVFSTGTLIQVSGVALGLRKLA